MLLAGLKDEEVKQEATVSLADVMGLAWMQLFYQN